MTNKQKAEELRQKYQMPCHGIGDCEFELYNASLEMAEWKEIQMIEKAIGWIDSNNRDGGCWFDGWEEDFKKAMMEEL